MSNKPSQLPQFSPKEFKESSKVERIAMYLRDSKNYHLTDSEIEYFELMKRTFAILSECKDQQTRENLITHIKTPALQIQELYKLINDTKELFGDVVRVNKKFDRMVLREDFLRLSRKAEEEGDIGESRRCKREAARIERLYEDDLEVFDPSELEIPDIILSSSENAFYGDAEEVDYEEA